MHRNTYLVVSALAVLAALVVGVNVGKRLSPAPLPATPQPKADQPPAGTPTPTLKTYVDSACGFSLEYGNEFTLSDSATGSAILINTSDQKKSIVMTCQKDIPPPPLTVQNIKSLSFPTTSGSSVSAKLYFDQTAKDGSLVDAVLFTHPTNKLDIFIAGYGDLFNNLLKTVKVIE